MGKKSKTQAGFNLEASHRRWSDLYTLQQRSCNFEWIPRSSEDTEDPCLDVHIQGKKKKVLAACRTPPNNLTGGFPLQLPRYTVASQLTLHSTLQHQQSVKLSSSQDATMKSVIHRNSTTSLFSCPVAKCNENITRKCIIQ